MIMCPQAHTNYQPEKYGCVELPFILMHLCFINLFFFLVTNIPQVALRFLLCYLLTSTDSSKKKKTKFAALFV